MGDLRRVRLELGMSQSLDVMVPPKTIPALGISVPSIVGYDGEAKCPEVVSRLSISFRKEGLLTV